MIEKQSYQFCFYMFSFPLERLFSPGTSCNLSIKNFIILSFQLVTNNEDRSIFLSLNLVCARARSPMYRIIVEDGNYLLANAIVSVPAYSLKKLPFYVRDIFVIMTTFFYCQVRLLAFSLIQFFRSSVEGNWKLMTQIFYLWRQLMTFVPYFGLSSIQSKTLFTFCGGLDYCQRSQTSLISIHFWAVLFFISTTWNFLQGRKMTYSNPSKLLSLPTILPV